MAKRGAAAAAPAAHVIQDSVIPVGGHDQTMMVPRPEPDTIQWAGVGTEVQADNNGEVVPAPVPRAPDEARDAKIRRLLRGEPEDAKPAETVTTTTEVTTEVAKPATEAKVDDGAEKPATPAAKVEPKPTPRRDLLANLQAERQKRETESALETSRTRIAELEAALRSKDDEVKASATADLYKIARARGLTREQALEAIIAAEESDDTPVVPAAKTDKPAEDPVVAELKRKVEQMEARDREAQAIQAYANVAKAIDPVEAPHLKSVRTISMPMTDAAGNNIVQPMTREAAVLTLAESMWNGDGKPAAANKNDYLIRAAEVLNEAIETGEIAASRNHRAGTAPAKVPAKDPPVATETEDAVAAVGTRMGGGGAPKGAGDGLPKDEHDRKAEIKRRFNLK